MHVTGCISAVKEEMPFASIYRSDATRRPRPTAVVHEFLHAFENLSNQHVPV